MLPSSLPLPLLHFATMTDAALTFTSAPGKDPDVLVVKLVGPLTLGNLFEFQDKFRVMTSPNRASASSYQHPCESLSANGSSPS